VGIHAVTFVASRVPLSRPRAANAGLDASTGDWITFLDDDDVLLPGHVAGLVAAQRNAGTSQVIYTLARAQMADGREVLWGRPFALQQLYERNFVHLATALFSRELLELGCRFDESFEIMQDWDFFLQCAQHTTFHFEPRQTFLWRAERGSSGAAGGANHQPKRFADFRNRIYEKWARQRDALTDRVAGALRDIVQRAQSPDLVGAEHACHAILEYSQNDPHVLNLLAMLHKNAGRLREARQVQELACAVHPEDPSLAYNLALVCRMQGDLANARRHAHRAVRTAPDFSAAIKLLADLDSFGVA